MEWAEGGGATQRQIADDHGSIEGPFEQELTSSLWITRRSHVRLQNLQRVQRVASFMKNLPWRPFTYITQIFLGICLLLARSSALVRSLAHSIDSRYTKVSIALLLPDQWRSRASLPSPSAWIVFAAFLWSPFPVSPRIRFRTDRPKPLAPGYSWNPLGWDHRPFARFEKRFAARLSPPAMDGWLNECMKEWMIKWVND